MSVNDKHYNPVVAARLRNIADGRQWSVLCTYLSSLSNSHFRTAGYMLGETFMPKMDESDFWTLANVLLGYNSKAFLVTILKSCISSSRPLFECEECCTFFLSMRQNDEEKRKTCETLLPHVSSPDTIRNMFQLLDIQDAYLRISLLIKSITPTTAFLLLNALREVEDNRAYMIRATSYLMKQGSGLQFNLASLIKTYFDLTEVKGTFSLKIEPYAMARLTSDYDAFLKAMKL